MDMKYTKSSGFRIVAVVTFVVNVRNGNAS
jgi:hypothetical protein